MLYRLSGKALTVLQIIAIILSRRSIMGTFISIIMFVMTGVMNLFLFLFRLIIDLIMWMVDLFRRR